MVNKDREIKRLQKQFHADKEADQEQAETNLSLDSPGEGLKRMKKVHDREVTDILAKEDVLEMNEHHRNPKQATPQARSDLPKHKHYEQTGHGKKGNG
ncbi:MAG: hypothetical protein UMV23_03735 [Halanaerobium sp.]|nr:hypothetical protein [Halanaerobium sp.]